MKAWIEVYDPFGNKLNDGPVTQIEQVRLTRALDRPGTFSVTIPATAMNSGLLLSKYRVKVFIEQYGIKREAAFGIIDDVDDRDNATSATRTIGGPDILAELKYKSTLLGREYSAETATDIGAALTALVPGWQWYAESEAAIWETSLRFDGDNVLRALELLAETGGYHIRRGREGRTVEFGTFGAPLNLDIMGAGLFVSGEHNTDEVAFIENISIAKRADAVATRIYPLGAGQSSDTALTLDYSDREEPYIIQSTVFNGRTMFYIEDAANAQRYGEIEKWLAWKTIAPIANTPAAIEAASNALYDIAAAWLERNSTELESIKVTITGTSKTILPGDRVRLFYIGDVWDEDGQRIRYREYDDYYWVMDVTETISASGVSFALTLNNIDRREQDTAEVLIGAIEEQRIQGVRVQPTFGLVSYGPFQRDMDSTHAVTITVPIIDDAVFELIRAQLIIITTPFRSNTTGAVSDGGSTATSAAGGGQTSSASGILNTGFEILTNPPSLSQHYHALATHSHTVADHQHNLDIPDHTHGNQYGIYDDGTNHPTNITVEVNGETVATGLDATGTGLNTVIDITDELMPPIAAALRQDHTIEITCASNRGSIEVIFLAWNNYLNFLI